jgi:hypothetical protein
MSEREAPKRARLYAGVAAFALVAGGAYVAGRATATPVRLLPSPTTVTVDVARSPNVLSAMRDLARLETEQFHFERTVDMTRTESHLYGAIQGKDHLLLVASGDVTAGVDLGDLVEGDVSVDWPRRAVTMTLPNARVLSSDLDEGGTRVFERHTSLFAHRDENLESAARQRAEQDMRAAAEDAGIVRRANERAKHTVEALLRSLGFREVTLKTRDANAT